MAEDGRGGRKLLLSPVGKSPVLAFFRVWGASLLTGMPLFRRELRDLARRRRSYVSRMLYALLVISAFLFYYLSKATAGSITEVYGAGRGLLAFTITAQVAGICVMVPVSLAGAIAGEKENRTLELLLATGMSPGEIVFQKYLGGIIPAMTALLIALPLLGLMYGMGGVSAEETVYLQILLAMLVLQAGSLALMMSAASRSTTTAIIGSYAAMAPVALVDYLAVQRIAEAWSASRFLSFTFAPGIFAPAVFLAAAAAFLEFSVRSGRLGGVSTGRAFLDWIDRGLYPEPLRPGAHRGRGVHSDLPDDRPVLWRDLRRSAVGPRKHFMRVACMLEVPALFLVPLSGVSGYYSDIASPVFALGLVITAAIAVFTVVAAASGIASSERAGGTLELLVISPIDPQQMVRDKVRYAWRIALLFAAPAATMAVWIAMAGAYHETGPFPKHMPALYHLGVTSAGFTVYCAIAIWLATWMGLRCRTRAKAIFWTLGIILAWTGAGAALVLFCPTGISNPVETTIGLTPAFLVATAACHPVNPEWPQDLLILVMNIAMHSIIYFFIKVYVIRNAEKLLSQAVSAKK
ncbi:MAG: ABC transporter permease subunit [Planctomycetes bacterium]|nr:ABC transporter permease subunit [Planctomycetota bacterium]